MTAYNLAMTAVSIAVALFIGSIEIVTLLKQSFSASGVIYGNVERLERSPVERCRRCPSSAIS
jgi:high-affinity nickel permease